MNMGNIAKCCDCVYADRNRINSLPCKDFGKIRCTRFSRWVGLFETICEEFVDKISANLVSKSSRKGGI